MLAAEYILNEGNPNVMLCERGIRTFESHTRFTLPLATVPYLHHKTHLPIVVDPSHGTGHTYLVPDMAVASIAAGADGIILEVHPDPERALSDGYQSLNFPQFLDCIARCRSVAAAVGRSAGATKRGPGSSAEGSTEASTAPSYRGAITRGSPPGPS